VLLALLLALPFCRQQDRADTAERDAGLAAARTLTEVFERSRALEVARLSGVAAARSEADGCMGLCTPTQSTRAPYEVLYTVDLKGLTPAAYRWNAEQLVMTVRIPEVMPGKPNVDMSRAQIKQSGAWISRKAGVELQRKAAGYLRTATDAAAKKPDHMASAQASARDAVQALVAAPLRAAGLTDVRVVVQLPGEARPAALDREQWDESRPLAEVLQDRR
jgi:hypothetical protein